MAFTPPSSLSAAITGPVTIAGTVAVSAVSLPLPAGAATSDLQTRELGALNDVGLTAILQREQVETGA